MIARALASLGLQPDPEPEGKRIEAIEIVRFPIIESSDPWPDFLNLFHVTTREHIVRQELLFSEGEGYDPRKIQESARNLRAFPLTFSTVRIVTARGENRDGVVVVVITKDLWSIRLNSQFSVGGGVFNYLSLMPTEQNFLGFNQQVSLYTFIDRDTFSVGQVYRVPRLLGSRLSLLENLNLRINHREGGTEGGFGRLAVEQPLFSVDSAWGYGLDAAFDLGTDRVYQGASLRLVEILDGEQRYQIPEVTDHQLVRVRLAGVRSFGRHWKFDLKAGYELRSFVYSLPGDFPAVPAAVERAFREAVLPLDDQGGWLLCSLRFYEARYARLQNIQTYGLSEDFRLGPDLSLELGWANPAFGFATQAITASLSLQWLFLLGGDILSLKGGLFARYSPVADLPETDSPVTDRTAEIELENVTPPLLGLGRLFVRFRYAYTQFSRTRSKLMLGGDNTLRGFVSGFTAGPRLLNVNVEFRSRPWVIETLHLGFVLFYDGGDTYGFTADTDFRYHHSAGFGIRGLFPQFDRGVVRLDVGVPLGEDFHTSVIDWVTLSYLQAF